MNQEYLLNYVPQDIKKRRPNKLDKFKHKNINRGFFKKKTVIMTITGRTDF